MFNYYFSLWKFYRNNSIEIIYKIFYNNNKNEIFKLNENEKTQIINFKLDDLIFEKYEKIIIIFPYVFFCYFKFFDINLPENVTKHDSNVITNIINNINFYG